MITVYRIEHKDAINETTGHYYGPFNGYFGCDGIDKGVDVYLDNTTLQNDNPQHKPIPCDDGMPLFSFSDSEYVFGCQSIDLLAHWFPNETGRAAMAASGYTVRRYDVPVQSRHSGGSQCAFNPAEAINVQGYDLVSLEPMNEVIKFGIEKIISKRTRSIKD